MNGRLLGESSLVAISQIAQDRRLPGRLRQHRIINAGAEDLPDEQAGRQTSRMDVR